MTCGRQEHEEQPSIQISLTAFWAAHQDVGHGAPGGGVQAGGVALLHVVQVDVSDGCHGLTAVVALLQGNCKSRIG